MEKKYWLGRKRAAGAMARDAVGAEARLIHYELAGRYSIKAAQCAAPAEGTRPVLHLAAPGRERTRGALVAGDGN